MIHGVTGPNEYENNVNNNWYTNLIASWTLEYTLENLAILPEEKRRRLDVREAEIEKWKDIIERMYYPYSEELNVFIQHDTFLDKELRQRMSLNRVTVRSIRTGHGIKFSAPVLLSRLMFCKAFISLITDLQWKKNVATLNFMNR